jgi:hypothetical protein
MTARVLRYLFFLSCLGLVPMMLLHAQEEGDTTIAPFRNEQLFESLLESDESEADNSELLDQVEWLQEHPLDLNKASAVEFSSIPQLSSAEISAIVNYRKLIKRFTSVEQLSMMPDGGEEILRKVRPFVVVEGAAEQGRTDIALRTRALRDLQPRKGFRENSFAGSSLKNYERLTLTPGQQVQAGVLFEKDAGERTSDGFISGYLSVSDWSFISRLVVGDFIVEAGQGLVLWRSSALSKGSEAITVAKRNALAIQPYRSTDEFHFFRGGALTSEFAMGEQTVAVSVFASRRSLAATATESSVSSFYEEGLFRTESERARKNALVEKLVGGRVEVRSGNDWNFGGSFYRSTFDKPIVAQRVFEFSGRTAMAGGIDGEMRFGGVVGSASHVTLFGELARSEGVAGVAGAVLSFGRRTNVAALLRSYSPRFVSLHANGFGERSDTKNERGFYIGAEAEISRGFRLTGYLDHYAFPWRTFSTPLPASGRDILVQCDASLTRTLDLVLRYSHKKQESSESSTDSLQRSIRPMVDRHQQKLRLTATLQAGKNLRLKGRAEATTVTYPLLERSEKGFLFYQDIQHKLSRSFTLEARLIFFHTDSYDSRVYEYENDLRGVFANLALYGKGWRWYLLMRWRVADIISFSAKYAETRKEGVASLGSGLTEILGDVDNRIGVQVEINW